MLLLAGLFPFLMKLENYNESKGVLLDVNPVFKLIRRYTFYLRFLIQMVFF